MDAHQRPRKSADRALYLINKNYKKAQKWYDEAAADFAKKKTKGAEGKPKLKLDAEQFSLFQFHCLMQLKKTKAAEEHLQQFFKETMPKTNVTAEIEIFALIRQLYVGQVFLSINAISEGVAYFEQQPEQSRPFIPSEYEAEELFAGKLTQAQLLLNSERFDEYAHLTTKEILPALYKRNLKAYDEQTIEQISNKMPLVSVSGFCLLPLMATEFVGSLSEKTVKELIPKWEAFREQTESQTVQLWIDRFLSLAYSRIENQNQANVAKQRYDANPQKAKFDLETLMDNQEKNIRRQLQLWQALQRL